MKAKQQYLNGRVIFPFCEEEFKETLDRTVYCGKRAEYITREGKYYCGMCAFYRTGGDYEKYGYRKLTWMEQ